MVLMSSQFSLQNALEYSSNMRASTMAAPLAERRESLARAWRGVLTGRRRGPWYRGVTSERPSVAAPPGAGPEHQSGTPIGVPRVPEGRIVSRHPRTAAATEMHRHLAALRAIDDPDRLSRAVRIVRLGLERGRITLADLGITSTVEVART